MRSYYLFEDYSYADVLDLPVKSRIRWLNSVEAARRFHEVLLVDDTKSLYAPERKLLRQWMETGRY